MPQPNAISKASYACVPTLCACAAEALSAISVSFGLLEDSPVRKRSCNSATSS
jgi:hypothetical protein